jgi:hypothetical protein
MSGRAEPVGCVYFKYNVEGSIGGHVLGSGDRARRVAPLLHGEGGETFRVSHMKQLGSDETTPIWRCSELFCNSRIGRSTLKLICRFKLLRVVLSARFFQDRPGRRRRRSQRIRGAEEEAEQQDGAHSHRKGEIVRGGVGAEGRILRNLGVR